MSDVGDPLLSSLGVDLDIRTVIPQYVVWRDGGAIDRPADVMKYWRDDLVSFVIGCSYSFEEAMMADDLPIRHIEQNVLVPMYRTNIACKSAGPFAGPMVVSMRPLKPADAIRAVQITSRFPAVHGAPVHLGLPQAILFQIILRQAEQGEPARLAARHHAAMLPQALQRAERPAEALLGEAAQRFGALGPGDGILIIGDLPAGALDRDGQVLVFGEGVVGITADFWEGG
eukprot:gene61809-84524_t